MHFLRDGNKFIEKDDRVTQFSIDPDERCPRHDRHLTYRSYAPLEKYELPAMHLNDSAFELKKESSIVESMRFDLPTNDDEDSSSLYDTKNIKSKIQNDSLLKMVSNNKLLSNTSQEWEDIKIQNPQVQNLKGMERYFIKLKEEQKKKNLPINSPYY